MATYQIADEPAPGNLARFAVNPVFPLLALMLGGVWLAFPWFAFNSIAVGSPTRRAELAWLVGGLLAFSAICVAIGASYEAGLISEAGLPYAFLVLVVAKIAVGYVVHVLQSRTIEIYEYFGGVLKNGVWGVAAAFFVGDRLIQDVPALVYLVLQ
jgi:hypothetical protein